tara:strand:+ start:55 stop:165 length:111 start_codon:yes stop_codon:yes gene_type:complete
VVEVQLEELEITQLEQELEALENLQEQLQVVIQQVL